MDTISLSGAVKMFLFEKSASGRSLHTIADYRNYLDLLATYLKDPDLDHVTPAQINTFLNYLQKDYRAKRAGVPTDKLLSPKTIANVQATLNVFWSWAAETYRINSPCTFDRIKFTEKPIDPLSEEDVQAMLTACDTPSKAKRKGQREYEISRQTRKRDRAVIYFLLDTGARATELCGVQFKDIDIDTGRIKVTGKGNKTRFVYLGRKGKSAVWAYMLDRFPRGKFDQEAYLFTDDGGHLPLNRDSLRHMLIRIGNRANVTNPHPHRFRHTFAVEYLRNGGDVFTLQQLLGHTTLTMVMRYVKLAQVDMEKAHKRANPSDNWRIR